MAISVTSNTASSFQPVFKRVQQRTEHDDSLACIAIVTGKQLDDVLKAAITEFGHPTHGPYWPLDETKISGLLASFGMVATVYKEVTKGIIDLPDVAIVMVDYNAETELGRHVVFVRDGSNQKAIREYIIDCAYWIDSGLHVRNDFKNVTPAWFIGVHPMRAVTTK
jgi:hypothetical protein